VSQVQTVDRRPTPSGEDLEADRATIGRAGSAALVAAVDRWRAAVGTPAGDALYLEVVDWYLAHCHPQAPQWACVERTAFRPEGEPPAATAEGALVGGEGPADVTVPDGGGTIHVWLDEGGRAVRAETVAQEAAGWVHLGITTCASP
jgi:hypothetical protein